MITWRARIYKLREPTPPGPIPDTTGQARNTPEPWGSGPARFQTAPPACYRASWQLPGPDFHRQATTSLRTRRNTTDYLTVLPPVLLGARKRLTAPSAPAVFIFDLILARMASASSSPSSERVYSSRHRAPA